MYFSRFCIIAILSRFIKLRESYIFPLRPRFSSWKDIAFIFEDILSCTVIQVERFLKLNPPALFLRKLIIQLLIQLTSFSISNFLGNRGETQSSKRSSDKSPTIIIVVLVLVVSLIIAIIAVIIIRRKKRK